MKAQIICQMHVMVGRFCFFLMATCFSGSAVELSAYTVYVCFGRFGSIY